MEQSLTAPASPPISGWRILELFLRIINETVGRTGLVQGHLENCPVEVIYSELRFAHVWSPPAKAKNPMDC